MDYKAYALMGILLASVALVGASSTAFAQTGRLTVSTDKESYGASDTVTVSGNVGTVRAGQPLLIQVFNPNGAAYRFDQVTVAADGSYTYPFKVGGPIGIGGEYRVVVSYGGSNQAETNFTFAGGELWIKKTIDIGGNNYTFEYQITGGSLTDLEADVDTSTLTATIDSTSDGKLTIRLPRDVMDSRAGADGRSGADEDYVVLADETEGDFEQIESTSSRRTLAIDFEAGTETIEIIGTFIIPEFGAIAAIVLAVAIVGIIVATTRYNTKFSFLPKF